ncbi:IucA/IucC family protein [Floridanema aerugineum]|uniref:IucA/IucC family siderophore biosynthesis protein n=1 Tax=Floridaenema aerugineum BLCC-F46 TaxID=3153654 RepID=A0ABV4X4V6_9CYAN
MTEATLNPTVSQSFSAKEIAEQATMQSFLNCYLRESGEGEVLRSQKLGTDLLIHCFLSHQNIEIFAGLHYYSPTGRHILSFPMYYQSLGKNELLPLDYVTLTALITKELMLASNQNGHQDELLLRVVQSCRNIEQFVQERYKEIPELYGFKRSFRETEQALVFGHHLHPTPKSRQGFSEEDLPLYSPELKASFSPYYFRAHQSIIQEDSNSNETATNLIKKELLADAEVAPEFKQKYCQTDEYSLIPVHPWEAEFLKRKPSVQKLLKQGLLEDLGQQGKAYFPTSSIRTVYHPNSSFMFKFSLNVKITNSLRTNLYKELERGVEVSRILDTKIGQELQQKFSEFQIVKDPAYITIKGEEELTSGFATVLRENPFCDRTDATCIISLCQDTITGKSSRLAAIIKQLAEQEKRLIAEVALDWFQRYLKLSLEPIVWLYFTYGIAVEAHQQNSVLQLKDGYPDKFFYRDNQGYYYRESFRQKLETILPGISEKSQTFCEDAVIDERLGYYLVMNNLLGLVNAFGIAELIDENLLILEVRKTLEKHLSLEQGCSKFLENLLTQSQLRCKGNLLTRFHDMDELVGSVATQSVYVTIQNPLAI